MTPRTLPFTDLNLAPVILGMMRLCEQPELANTQALSHWLMQRLEEGFTTFDHADIYGSNEVERRFGEVLKSQPQLRQQMQLISKCGIRHQWQAPSDRVKHYNNEASYILDSVDGILQRLGCEQLDLLLLHRPDPLQQPEEVAQAFTQLLQQGKVRCFGVSNYLPVQFELLQQALPMPLVTNQIEFSLLARAPLDNGQLSQMQLRGITPMYWSPLGGAQLFKQPEHPLLQSLTRMAKELGCTLDAVALAWVMHHPAAGLPLVGSFKEERLQGYRQACELRLSRLDWYELWEKAQGEEVA